MTTEVLKSWDSCINNIQFQEDMLQGDGDVFPSRSKRIFMPHNDKVIWATIYYGWLVGKYGNDWEEERAKFL